MNKITVRVNRLSEISKTLERQMTLLQRNYSSRDKDKDKDDKDTIEDSSTVRQGMLHDKQKSLQEESFFHKEEKEQLKELQKKLKKKKTEEPEK